MSERDVRRASQGPTDSSAGASLPVQLRDLVLELDRVERGPMPYVVLTWFLKNLPASRLPWSVDERERRLVLNDAIQRGLLSTRKIDNPKEPGRDVTIVSLQRAHPEVVSVLRAAYPLPKFDPVPIKGESLSEQIIRERR